RIFVEHMVTLSFTIFFGQKNLNRAHMLFQVLCGFEPIFYTTHPNEEPNISSLFSKIRSNNITLIYKNYSLLPLLFQLYYSPRFCLSYAAKNTL
ncbi:MAG: hypothetical protein MR663_02955, partial [Lachnospiraceae bacterium]|nr:hypothetical protein [Lachnospiraceae bacterium]